MKHTSNRTVIFANSIIAGTILLFVVAILYLFYKSSLPHSTLNIRAVIILASGLVFLIIILFLRDSWRINIAVSIFSIIISLYAVESVLLVQYNSRFSQAEIDTRNKLEVLEDMRAEGVDAWPQVLAWLFVKSDGLLSENGRIFPLGGISDKMVVYCNESGQYKIFKSDEHGLNNPNALYKKDTVTIVLLGDSFTIGSCVKEGEDIAGRLRGMEIKTLNLGNGGNGPLIELAALKEYVEPVQPEIVLWIYYEGNDLLDLEKERTSSMLMSYLKDDHSQSLLERQDEIDAALVKYVNSQWTKEAKLPQMRNLIQNQPLLEQKKEEKEKMFRPLKLWYLRKRIGLVDKTLKPKREVSFKTQLALFSKILDTAYQRSLRWGGEFYFVYLPDMERYVGDNDNGAFYDRADVLARVNKLGIPLIDFHDVLGKHPEPLSLTPFLGAHYNAEGYKLVTELIVSRLRKDGLL